MTTHTAGRGFGLPHVLLILYLGLFTVCAIRPFDRTVWIAENAPILLLALILVVTYRWYRFSDAAYLLMSVLLFMHTIGGHYTFERVPFDWFTNAFGFHRNHYDRIAHFSVGFWAYGLAELVERKRLINSRLLVFLFPVCAILAVAAGYEIFEWWYAVNGDPNAGAAVLGSQGDVWDAQKDMLMDGLGALVAAGAYLVANRPRRP